MREIKFRAWDKENKKMYVVDEIYFRGGYICVDKLSTINDFTRFYNLADVELMQFTGLRDKNGKEIFERDIICYNRKRNLPNCEVVYYVVKFDERTASFLCYEKNQEKIAVPTLNKKAFVKISGAKNLAEDSMSECEVLGNIYENPDLLES